MKIILFLLSCITLLPAYAAECTDQQPAQDTTTRIILTNDRNMARLFSIGQNALKSRLYFRGHWNGFQYGFINIAHLPEGLQSLELDPGHSFSMHFNLGKQQFSLISSNTLGLVTGIGMEYQRLRFKDEHVSIAKDGDGLEIIDPLEGQEINEIKRSSFKTLYLTVPVLLEFQFPAKQMKRMYVSAGFEGGVRMHSKTKVVYKDKEGSTRRLKDKGNFNMVPVKVDVVGQFGYRLFNAWCRYSLTNMFKGSRIPDLHLYSAGIGLNF